MSWLSAYVILAIILHAQGIEAASSSVPTLQDITNSVSSLCDNIEHLSERVCDTVIGGVEKRINSICSSAINKICNSPLLYPLSLLHQSASSCERNLNRYVCNIDKPLFEFANTECIEEIHKIVIGQRCENGEEANICDGLPSTIGGVCTLVIDETCDRLPWILDPLIPHCQKYFSQLVC